MNKLLRGHHELIQLHSSVWSLKIVKPRSTRILALWARTLPCPMGRTMLLISSPAVAIQLPPSPARGASTWTSYPILSFLSVTRTQPRRPSMYLACQEIQIPTSQSCVVIYPDLVGFSRLWSLLMMDNPSWLFLIVSTPLSSLLSLAYLDIDRLSCRVSHETWYWYMLWYPRVASDELHKLLLCQHYSSRLNRIPSQALSDACRDRV